MITMFNIANYLKIALTGRKRSAEKWLKERGQGAAYQELLAEIGQMEEAIRLFNTMPNTPLEEYIATQKKKGA